MPHMFVFVSGQLPTVQVLVLMSGFIVGWYLVVVLVGSRPNFFFFFGGGGGEGSSLNIQLTIKHMIVL